MTEAGKVMESAEPKKLALLRILQVLKNYSDIDHPLKQEDIVSYLSKDYGLQIERKAVGRNITLLKEAGYDIQSSGSGCWLSERDFEDSELKMLIDGVLSSKYISESHSKELIEKLCKQSNIYFRSHVKNIYSVGDWSKTDNCAVFYNIEIIDEAIESGKQIKLIYNKFFSNKEFHKSSRQTVSPYQLIVNNQRYYLMCFNEYWHKMSFYRIDRITDIEIIDKDATPLRSLEGYENGINYREISSSLPYMFSDKKDSVAFIADEKIVDQIIDWFGYDILIEQLENKKIKVTVNVSQNAMEYWAMQYLNYVEIIYPESLRNKIKDNLDKAVEKYNKR